MCFAVKLARPLVHGTVLSPEPHDVSAAALAAKHMTPPAVRAARQPARGCDPLLREQVGAAERRPELN